MGKPKNCDASVPHADERMAGTVLMNIVNHITMIATRSRLFAFST